MNILVVTSYMTRKNLIVVLVSLTLLNLADLVTTVISLNSGLYEELNHIIKFLYSQSLVLMVSYKLLIPLIPFIFLFRFRNRIKSNIRDNYSDMSLKEIIQNVILSSTFLAMVWATFVYLLIVIHNIVLLWFGNSII